LAQRWLSLFEVEKPGAATRHRLQLKNTEVGLSGSQEMRVSSGTTRTHKRKNEEQPGSFAGRNNMIEKL